jgi:hypothetical protein
LSGEIYFADTSALISAWFERYPPELFGSMSRFIDELGGRVKVIEEARNEIDRHADDTASEEGMRVNSMRSWLQNSEVDTRLSLLSLDKDDSNAVQQTMVRIVNGWPSWHAVRRLNNTGSCGPADPWVVAYAYAYQGVVVSEEKPRASGRGDVEDSRCL